MLDEANARARIFLAWTHKWLTTNSDVEREGLEKGKLHAAGRAFSIMRLYVDLYGEDKLKAFVLEKGKFPAPVHRMMLHSFMEEIAHIDLYKRAAKTQADTSGNRTLTLPDGIIEEAMRFNGDVYGSMYGMGEYLKTHAFLTGRESPLNQKLPENGNERGFQNTTHVISNLAHFLEFLSSNHPCGAHAPEQLAYFLKHITPAQHKNLSSIFMWPIILDMFDLARLRLDGQMQMNGVMKAEALSLLDRAEAHLLKGMPIDRASLKKPLRNPDLKGPACPGGGGN